jgi:hypothetical protein
VDRHERKPPGRRFRCDQRPELSRRQSGCGAPLADLLAQGAAAAHAAYTAREIWQHKPAMMICRVVRDKSFTCVRGGALLRVALGYDVTNKDLLSLVPEDQRAARLDWAWAITEGAITVLYRRFASKEGHDGLTQGIALPFSGEDTNGSRHLLLHTNWRPVGTDWIIGNVDVDLQNTSDRRMISFMTESAKLSDVVNL